MLESVYKHLFNVTLTITVLSKLRQIILNTPRLLTVHINPTYVTELNLQRIARQIVPYAGLEQRVAGSEHHLNLVHLVVNFHVLRQIGHETVNVSILMELQKVLIRRHFCDPVDLGDGQLLAEVSVIFRVFIYRVDESLAQAFDYGFRYRNFLPIKAGAPMGLNISVSAAPLCWNL